MKTYRQPFQNEWPITQKYGDTLTSTFHTGIDYGCPIGTNILASESGTIMFAGWDKTGYGNMVIIQHDADHSTLYAHLSLICVHVGQNVRKGEKIGESGNTGYSTGPHLHFEARTKWNDFRTHFDPMKLPLMSVDDFVPNVPSKSAEDQLINAPDLKTGDVVITAPAGAFCHYDNFTKKFAMPLGTELNYVGEFQEKNGLEFCKCYLEVWVAVNNGETQILENVNEE